MKLEGRAVLLAGARRVGVTIAHRLAREGAHLGLLYRSSAAAAASLRDSLLQEGAREVALVQADLTIEDQVQGAVEAVRAALGDLFAVVNLASDFEPTPLDSLDGACWDRALGQARASYLLAIHASRRMIDNPGPTRGHLLFFGDWAAGETPYRGYLPYLTAKAAIGFMTRAFAVELAPHGILCNAIAPGPTLRPPDIPLEVWQRDVLSRTPLDRESSPDDIAELALTLLRADTITGEVIRVDSGRHLAGPGHPS